jgi:hypothetical protein
VLVRQPRALAGDAGAHRPRPIQAPSLAHSLRCSSPRW